MIKNFLLKQNIYTILSYIIGIIGIIMLIDGIFILPWNQTRYGYENIGINNSIIFFIISYIFLLNNKINKLNKNCNCLTEKDINNMYEEHK